MRLCNLYHATSRKNTESILREGLKRGHPSNWNGMCMQDMLYLAVNPETARNYVETSDTYQGEGIDVFRIDAEKLDQNQIGYDWNNRCEYEDDINSVSYNADIPAEFIKIANESASGGTIHDFFGTDWYERIMEVFHCENAFARE